MPGPELRLSAFASARTEEPRRGRFAAVASVASFVTVSGLGVALYLGTLGYDVRRSNMHDRRLKGILVQTPTVYQVTEGLKEKAPLVLVIDSPRDLNGAVDRWGAEKSSEIRAKARSWPQLRVFAAGDMMYFIYFDDTDVMQDYVYVTSKGES